ALLYHGGGQSRSNIALVVATDLLDFVTTLKHGTGRQSLILEVGGFPCFDPKGDPNTLSIRWRRWKRASNLYMVSKGVTNEQQKQKENETIDQFVCRLRQKSISCEFTNVDEAIRDQIIEKCRDPKLRRKFLEKTGTVTLSVLQDTARVHETVNTQMQSMDRSGTNQVHGIFQGNRRGKGKYGTKPDDRASDGKHKEGRKCYRCNMTGHIGRDKNCPAISKTCKKRGLVGHFAVCCRTKAPKKPSNGKQRQDGAYQVEEKKQKPETDNYAFVVKPAGEKTGGVVDLIIGGVELINVLIHSGASCNIMDRATWENLKQKGVKCESQKSEKKLFAYGQTNSIEVLGTFKSDIFCKDSRVSCVDEFTVVEGPGKVLLGKNTAEKLNVLRVGPPRSPQVYSVAYEGSDKDIMNDFKEIFLGVGKLKDFQMKLHIKDDVKSVAQPVRRLPFGLRVIRRRYY
ncbi:Neural cell adhesion molecule 1, partial [Paramuricea clavata]